MVSLFNGRDSRVVLLPSSSLATPMSVNRRQVPLSASRREDESHDRRPMDAGDDLRAKTTDPMIWKMAGFLESVWFRLR